MIASGAPSQPRVHHLMHDGTSVWSTQILRSQDPSHPQAVLVEQSPHSVVKPHFHQTTQFQVAVEGSGSLNNHDLRPIAVHYALRQTSYGPIVAGDHGLSYLALRPARDPGPLWIPEDVAKLDRKGRRRQVTSPAYDVGAATAARPVVDVLSLDDTGVGSWLVRAPPGGRIAAPGGGGDGRFVVVLRGDIAGDDGVLGRLAVVWISQDVADFEIAAGPSGLDALVLQFPAGSTAPAPIALAR